MSAASRHGGLPDDMDELDVWLEEHVDLADRCRAMCPRPDGSFWVCSFSAGHDGSHSWTDKPTEFWGGDPDEVRSSDSLAESQAGLSGPGSPTSPPQRAYAAWKSCAQFAPHERHEWIDGALRRDCPGVPNPKRGAATSLGQRAAVDAPQGESNSAAARSAATGSRRTYRVWWSRASNPSELLMCRGLTGSVAFARLLNAVQEDRITVHSIEPEGRVS